MKYSKYYLTSTVIVLLLVTLSYGLYSVESATSGSQIDSFGDAFWYMIVTLTTVGYGDVYPTTFIGRLIGVVFVVGSLGVLGFLIGQLSELISSLRERRRLGLNGTNFTDHVVVIGWNDLSKIVVDKLLEEGNRVALLVEKKDSFESAENHYDQDNLFLTFSDTLGEQEYDRVNLGEATNVFINRAGDAENLITVLGLNEYDPEARTILCVYNEELIKTFNAAGASYVLSRQDILAQIISNYINSPHEEVFTRDFIEEAEEDGVFQVSGN